MASLSFCNSSLFSYRGFFKSSIQANFYRKSLLCLRDVCVSVCVSRCICKCLRVWVRGGGCCITKLFLCFTNYCPRFCWEVPSWLGHRLLPNRRQWPLNEFKVNLEECPHILLSFCTSKSWDRVHHQTQAGHSWMGSVHFVKVLRSTQPFPGTAYDPRVNPN